MPSKIFQIAGFKIKIIFNCLGREKIPLMTSKWYEDILKPFFINKHGKADFIIRFEDILLDANYLIKSNNSLYIKLFSVVKDNEIITHPKINVAQFEILIQKVLVSFAKKDKNLLFLHASAVEYNRKAYLFLGKKRAGKSTIIRLVKNGFNPLCDDKCIVRKEGDFFYFYQLPLVEKNHFVKTEKRYSIGKIFIVHKADKYSLKKIKFQSYADFRNNLKDYILYEIPFEKIVAFNKSFKNHIYDIYFPKKDIFIMDKIRSFIDDGIEHDRILGSKLTGNKNK